MEHPYQELLDENIELGKALTGTKELVERYRTDNVSLKQMHEDFKLHYERLKKENVDLMKANADLASRLRETQEKYESQLNRLRTGLEQKQKEMEAYMSTVDRPLDQDMLRIKLISEIEGPHRQMVEQLQRDLNELQVKNHDLNNKTQLIQMEYGNYRVQAEKEYTDLERRYMEERANSTNELRTLHAQLEELRDPEQLRLAKKDRDDLRRRVGQQSIEIEELTKARERMKSERSTLQIQATRDLEEEKDLRRTTLAENNSLQLQNKDLTDQLRQTKLQLDLKLQQLSALNREKDQLRASSKVFEDQVTDYRSEIAKSKDEMQRKVTDLELRLRNVLESEQQKLAKEKQDKDRLQKDLETMEKALREKEGFKTSGDKGNLAELERLQHQVRAQQEDYNLLKASAAKLQQENDLVKETTSRLKAKEEEVQALLAQTREDEVVVRELQGNVRRLEEALHNNERELATLRSKTTSEEGRAQISALKAKVREYKAKVRQGNEKLQEFGRKLAQSELERQRMRQLQQEKEGVRPPLSNLVGETLAYEDSRLHREIRDVSARLKP